MQVPVSDILIGAAADQRVHLHAAMANRHGFIAGATGTGKTVSLQVLAEGLSRAGVPVFSADIKGDLAGIARPGTPHPKIEQRLRRIGITDHAFEANPVLLWDVYGRRGHPVRTTISQMGPVLLANLLELNEVQEGVLHLAFRLADEQGLLLLDLKDLRAMLGWLSGHASEVPAALGRVPVQSVAAIQRRLLVLEEAGGECFFGEPALRIEDLMQTDFSGRGVVSLLDAATLHHNPRIYATFLLWLLSELMETLPERGDAPRPRLVFFFDEAHLLFQGAPRALLEKVAQTVRLIRSKGVGVFFVTQYPDDVPAPVLGQLGNRVQHALRAFTPRERDAVSAAAKSFRSNPDLDVSVALTELGIGEALVSCLDDQGVPGMVQRTLVAPPRSRIGPLDDAERADLIDRSPLGARYAAAIDRESAHEILQARAADIERSRAEAAGAAQAAKAAPRARTRQGVGEAFLKSMVRTVGSTIGRQIVRGLLGSISGRR